MSKEDKQPKAKSLNRRHFLHKSAKEALPYLAGLVGASKLIAAGGTSNPNELSPLPTAQETAPSKAKEELDRHAEKFAAENPDFDPQLEIPSEE